MRTTIGTAIAIFLAAGPVASQEEDATSLDIYAEEVGADAIPVLSEVESAASAAFSTFDAGDCSAAIPLLQDVADDANRLSNLLRQTIEPFYSARNDDQEAFSRNNRADMSALAATEERANQFLRIRNRAWVSEAECLSIQGDRDAAAIAAFRALNLIDTNETETWRRARTLMWNIIGFEP